MFSGYSKIVLVILLSTFALNGCSTTVTMVGSKSPAVSIDQVEVLYKEPDKRYETIALINDSAGTRLTSIESGISICREKAATLGANAIVVLNTKNPWSGAGGASVDVKAIRWTE